MNRPSVGEYIRAFEYCMPISLSHAWPVYWNRPVLVEAGMPYSS